MSSDFPHLLSFALIYVFDLLILIMSMSQYLLYHNYKMILSSFFDKAYVLNYTKAKSLDVSPLKNNNSDNNFQINQNYQHSEVGRLDKLSRLFQKLTFNKRINLRSTIGSSNIMKLLKILRVKLNMDYQSTVCKNCLCAIFILYHPIFDSLHSVVKNRSPL